MKKQDLKTGMRVKIRSGDLYLVLKDCETTYYSNQSILFAGFDDRYGFLVGTSYDDNLEYKGDSQYDIVEVFTTKYGMCDSNILNVHSLKSIYKKEIEPKKEMTIQEIQEILGYGIKIIE